MKILLIGEYNRSHNFLKQGLQNLGHQATVVGLTDGFKKVDVDIEIKKDFKKKVTEPIKQEILKLTEDIESLRNFKEDTLKKRQANEIINIKEEVSLAEKGNKYLAKINQRLEQTNLIISEGSNE